MLKGNLPRVIYHLANETIMLQAYHGIFRLETMRSEVSCVVWQVQHTANALLPSSRQPRTRNPTPSSPKPQPQPPTPKAGGGVGGAVAAGEWPPRDEDLIAVSIVINTRFDQLFDRFVPRIDIQ